MRYLLALSVVMFLTSTANADEFMGVTIAPVSNESSYERSLYKHWSDFNDDDEDTRVEVLIDESILPVSIQEKSSGVRYVISGLWVDSYTGNHTTNPKDLQIDHMVPLKEAHISGAHAWDADKREQYANDLELDVALIAVWGGSNQSKGARDPANWMPPNRTYWCQYLDEWLAVKRKWGLTMDQKEADAIRTGLRVCDKYRIGDSLIGRH